MDFTGSGDTDGTITSYNVTQTDGTVVVVVGGTSTPTPYFIAPTTDTAQTLTFELTVTDDKNATSEVSTVSFGILAENVNAPPTITNFTGDATANAGDTVTLTATASDSENDTLTYTFNETTSVGVTLTPSGNTVSYTAGQYAQNTPITIRAIASDSELSSDPVEFTTTVAQYVPPVENTAPIANAGQDQSVDAGVRVLLNSGGATITTEGATVASYLWEQLSGTPVNIIAASSQVSQFDAPSTSSAHVLVFTLTVTDSNGLVSAPDSVTINVAAVEVEPPVSNRTIPVTLTGIPDGPYTLTLLNLTTRVTTEVAATFLSGETIIPTDEPVGTRFVVMELSNPPPLGGADYTEVE